MGVAGRQRGLRAAGTAVFAGRVAICGLTVIGLVGCSSVSTPPDLGPASSTPSQNAPAVSAAEHRAAAQHTADALLAAVRGEDQVAFRRLISDRDPHFPQQATILFDNLRTLQSTGLRITIEQPAQTLNQPRRRLLGEDAWVVSARAFWQLPGDSEPASQEIWLTFLSPEDASPSQRSAGRSVLLAGTTDLPVDHDVAPPQPLWMLEPIRLLRSGPITLVAGSTAQVSGWADRAKRGRESVISVIGPAREQTWTGAAVLELPSTTMIMEQQLGASRHSYDQIGAVTWPEGTDTAKAPLRIVINPGLTARSGTLGLDVLLTHEMVHLATHSVGSQIPTWLIEGYADFVAFQAYPDAQRVNAAQLDDQLSRTGFPSGLPADADFRPEAPDLESSYALAWSACRYLAQTYGQDRLNEFYAAAAAANSDDIGPVLGKVFDIDLTQFVEGWQHYLQDRSGNSHGPAGGPSTGHTGG